MTQATAPVTALEKTVEYQAFGSPEKVKLSVQIVKQWLCTPTKSGKVASDSEVMKFIMLCKARQLNPWEGDAFLVGYDSNAGAQFSLITAFQAFLKRAEAHPEYDGMESGVIVEQDGKLLDQEGDFLAKGQRLVGAWAKVYRKDQGRPKVARLNLEVFDKGFAQWRSNPAGMIVKCAEADAMRGAFPNTLGGLYNDEEMQPRLAATEADALSAVAEKTKENQADLRKRLAPPVEVEPAPVAAIDTIYSVDAPAIETVDEGIKAGAESLGHAQQADDITVSFESQPDGTITADGVPLEPFVTPVPPHADLYAAVKDKYGELKSARKKAANEFLGQKMLKDLTPEEMQAFLDTEF